MGALAQVVFIRRMQNSAGGFTECRYGTARLCSEATCPIQNCLVWVQVWEQV